MPVLTQNHETTNIPQQCSLFDSLSKNPDFQSMFRNTKTQKEFTHAGVEEINKFSLQWKETLLMILIIFIFWTMKQILIRLIRALQAEGGLPVLRSAMDDRGYVFLIFVNRYSVINSVNDAEWSHLTFWFDKSTEASKDKQQRFYFK